jgi:ABC-type Fe3+/spermidine/putrescine transport system ATPase subunit
MLSFDSIDLQRPGFQLRIGPQRIPPCTRLTLIGPSGGGKSTLLRALLGLENSAQVKELCWMGASLSTLPLHHRPFAWLPQELGLWPHLNALQHVAFARSCGRHTRSQPQDLALLEQLGLTHRAQARPAQLSGGERQRLACARVLAQERAWAVLDEPFCNLDPVLTHTLEHSFAKLAVSSHMGIIQVSHQVKARTADEIFWVIEAGELTQSGPWNQLLDQPATPWIQRYALLQRC